MTKLRAHVYRLPDADVRGIFDVGPVLIPTGWAFEVWFGKTPVTSGVQGDQQAALNAACRMIKSLSRRAR